jgi:hypothetical protein
MESLITDIIEAVRPDVCITEDEMRKEFTDQIVTGDDEALKGFLVSIRRSDLCERISVIKELNGYGKRKEI